MKKTIALLGGLALAASATAALAHHGTSISYKMDEQWTTEATVVSFAYANPHPHMTFTRVNERGQVENWDSELLSNPSGMTRGGWNRSKSIAAMQPGTKVKLTLSTSKANPRSAVVRAIQNMAGEYIVIPRGGGGGGAAAPGDAR